MTTEIDIPTLVHLDQSDLAAQIATLNYNQLNDAIDDGFATLEDIGVQQLAYLQAMKNMLSSQGQRSDLQEKAGVPVGMTWYRWVRDHQKRVGSLSAVKRMLKQAEMPKLLTGTQRLVDGHVARVVEVLPQEDGDKQKAIFKVDAPDDEYINPVTRYIEEAPALKMHKLDESIIYVKANKDWMRWANGKLVLESTETQRKAAAKEAKRGINPPATRTAHATGPKGALEFDSTPPTSPDGDAKPLKKRGKKALGTNVPKTRKPRKPRQAKPFKPDLTVTNTVPMLSATKKYTARSSARGGGWDIFEVGGHTPLNESPYPSQDAAWEAIDALHAVIPTETTTPELVEAV